MIVNHSDISTWNKTAKLLYSTNSYAKAILIHNCEFRNTRREYNLKRIRGRIKHLFAKALLHHPKMLEKVLPSKLKLINQILGSETSLRSYLKFAEDMSPRRLYSFLKYEVEHKNRSAIKKVLIAQIVKEKDFGIREEHGKILNSTSRKPWGLL